jgi:hypothetical protein
MCSLFGRLLSDMWKVTKGLKYPDFTDLLCPPGGKKSVLHFTQSLMGNFVSPDSTVCSLDSPQNTGCQFLLILGLKNIISILIIDIFRCWSWYIKKAIHRYFTWIITSSNGHKQEWPNGGNDSLNLRNAKLSPKINIPR